MIKKALAVGVTILFFLITVTPMVIGYTSDDVSGERDMFLKNLAFMFYDSRESNDRYEYYKEYLLNDYSNDDLEIVEEDVVQLVEPSTVTSSDGPMDSAWPMKCHDLRHTAQSPYSTADNPGTEMWRFRSEHHLGGTMESSPVISDDGTIYFGTMGCDHKLYALYPNGTKKWDYPVGLMIWSTPAIAEDETIYVTSYDHFLHAVYPNGTLKWKFCAEDSISSSPAIAEDGTIYFGCMGSKIFAVNPDGTEKWHHNVGYITVSDPAIGDDGTIYIGSGDHYLYALYPNGTLRWRFKTGGEIHGHPSIAEDGTIYIPSYDGNLYALYPNGTLRWEAGVGYETRSSASIGEDGTLYIGTNKLYAIYPNGTMKWNLALGGDMSWSSPAISADATIYICAGTYLVAVNPDGTEKWRKQLGNLHARSSPIIGEDGAIYVGSSWKDEGGYWHGYLHAFESGEPKKIEIQSPEPGKLYLFGKDMGATPRNNTVIIGNINVEVHVYSEDELENGVSFYIDGSHQFTDTEPPFEWTMDKRFGRWPLMRHTIKVEAYYQGGCHWFEEMDILYIHFRKN